jgi:hypothetical protein
LHCGDSGVHRQIVGGPGAEGLIGLG